MIDPHLIEPTYQNRLRVIGRELDRQHISGITIMEVPGGFVVRAQYQDGEPVALEFLDSDFSQMVITAIAARGEGETTRPATALLPTGYEDFLRSLGYELDERVAEGVYVAEYRSFITVGGLVPSMTSGGYRHYSEVLGSNEIREILNEAFNRRGTFKRVTHYIPPTGRVAGMRR